MNLSTTLLVALIAVESNGDSNVVGAAGELGMLQCKAITVEDVNRIRGLSGERKFHHRDARSAMHAIFFVRVILGHYGTAALLGRNPTDRDLALIWHYGFEGARPHLDARSDPDGYWDKVHAALNDPSRMEAVSRVVRLPGSLASRTFRADPPAGPGAARAPSPPASPDSVPPSGSQ